jgi:hypothetical protein
MTAGDCAIYVTSNGAYYRKSDGTTVEIGTGGGSTVAVFG